MTSSITAGRLTVITGPSGVGKGTLVNQILMRNPEVWLSISGTTRLPRPGELDGEHYFFWDKKKFLKLIDENGFLEWAEFAGNYYGTPFEPVKNKLDQGIKVLLEIELEGARQVRKTFPEAFQIFIAPPSFSELEKRIRGRGTDREQAIIKRLSRAKEELMAKDEFDSVVINDELDKAILEIEKSMSIS